jgi:sporulation protein YlmC with PRC-barrel domain
MHEIHRTKLLRLGAVAAVTAALTIPTQAQNQTNSASGSRTNTGASQAGATQSTNYRALRASEVIGKSVRNPQGNDIGKIDDMVVDMNTGDVRYAILSFDPGILSSEKLLPVPVSELRMAADRDDIVYNVSRDKLERSAIDRSEWNENFLRDPARVGRIDTAAGTRAAQGRLQRASDLIGQNVKSRSGEAIGELEELVVNMAQQKVHYAVMGFDASWAPGTEKRYVLPLRVFDQAADRNELVLDVDKSKLQAMKAFAENDYRNLNDRALVSDVDRYFVTVLPTIVSTRTSNAGSSTNGTRQMGASGQAPSFQQLDRDRNGFLDRAEIRRSRDLDRDWSRLDLDGDGRVSRQEFASAYGTVAPRQDRN